MSIDIHPLIELFEFWFTDAVKFWFDVNPEFDDIIKTKYLTLFDLYSFDKISEQILSEIQEDYRKSIGLILLHDQISRHIYRNIKDKINYYLDLILTFSSSIYTRFKYDLKPIHYCFVLLPLRHTNNFDNIMFVINETKLLIKRYPNVQEYKRFLIATLERYIKFNDDTQNIIEYLPKIQKLYIEDLAQICTVFAKNLGSPKLESENASVSQKLRPPYGVLTLCDDGTCEIRKYYVTPYAEIDLKTLPEYITKMIDIIKINTPNKKSIISLSGGVDSMVMSYILKYIGIDIIAVHINYNNRPECDDECNILKQWCAMLNIKLYIRKITEIQRPEMMEMNMRDLYETYTRDIRFNTYMNANLEYDNIFLGHNHDDQFENIFTNIVSESHFDNLRGMTYQTQLKFKDNYLNFIRPMLDIPKENIYKFASYFSIPHFKDSTPKWSQRGKIRDIIRPNMMEWDDRSIDGFFKLSDKMADLIKIANLSAQLISDEIKKNTYMNIDLDNIYPKTLFSMIFIHLQIKISQKALTNFYDKLIFIKEHKQKYKINSLEKYRLNKDTIIMWKNLDRNNIIIYFV